MDVYVTCGTVSVCQALSCLWQSTAFSAVIFFKGMCWPAKCITAENYATPPAWTPNSTLLSNKTW